MGFKEPLLLATDHLSEHLLLTVPETAHVLRISRNLTYELLRQRTLPFVRLGRRVLIPRQALEEWITNQSELSQRVETVLR